MRIVDWPWARPGRLLRGQSQKPGDFSIQYFPLDRWENWDSENTELGPESFQHLLFSRLWPDRESQRGQLGLKSVHMSTHTCGQRRYHNSARGVGTVRSSYASSRVIRGNAVQEQKSGKTLDHPPPPSVLPTHQRDLLCPRCWERVEQTDHQPQRFLPSFPTVCRTVLNTTQWGLVKNSPPGLEPPSP